MAETAVARPLERRLAAHRSVAWVHGIVGGLASSVVMGLFMMVAMLITGYGFIRPLELIGSLWYGSITTGATVALLGGLTLLATGVILGVVWAYAFSYVKIDPLVSGVAYGAIVWALMQYLIIPAAGSFILGVATIDPALLFSTLVNPVAFPLWMVLAAFLVFGLSLGAFEDVADRRRLRRESNA